MSDDKHEFPAKTVVDRIREKETHNSPRISIHSEAVSVYKDRLDYNPNEKWRILKNLAVISLTFAFLYTAFQGMMNIQSSINAEHGLGTVALGMIFLSQMISCLIVPKLMIEKLTIKWTLIVTISFYAVYISAQFYPR